MKILKCTKSRKYGDPFWRQSLKLIFYYLQQEYQKCLYARALTEAAKLAKSHKQTLPENISMEELLNFNLMAEFDILRDGAPMLYHVVSGAMGLKKGMLQVIFICHTKENTRPTLNLYQNPTRHLPGGSRVEITLHQAIAQVMSQCHAISHPRTRTLLALVNGVLGLLKHQDEGTFKLRNTCGQTVSRKSATKVVDRFVRGKNKVSLD